MERFKKQFLQPADEFTPMPFWFWNDHLTKAEIIRQVEDFRAKGVMGFIIHPRIGIPNEISYLSDNFMQLVACAVETAQKYGMYVILYDEAMYPSGSAHGMVVKNNPKFASRGLNMVEYPVTGKKFELEIALDDPDDLLVSVQAVKKTSEKEIIATDTIKLPLEQGKVHFCAPDDSEWSVLVFFVTYSKGTIRGIHEGEDDGQPDAPAASDLLNPAAIDEYIRVTHERYYQVLKDHFGKTIIGMFTDEPSILGRRGKRGLRPWTNDFLSWYTAHGGWELDLPVLWFNAGDKTSAMRRIFKQAINSKLEQSYYAKISDWCANHNIALVGHPEASDEIGMLKYFHIPGQDIVWRWVAPENELAVTGQHSTQGKCSSDAARHSGARRNSNECFACCGANKIEWSFTVADMKWYMDWLFVRGVNLLYPHAFFYSVDGKIRYGERPPDVGPNNIWWPYYRTISDYMKRMSWIMTDSVNQAQVAVLCEPDFLPWQIVRPLYENQIEFNYLENTLFKSDVNVVNGRLEIAKQSYRVVVIEDESHVTPAVTAILEQFIAQGGKVIIFDRDLRESVDDYQQIMEFDQVVEGITHDIKRDLVSDRPEANLRMSHVVKDSIHFFVLVNEGESPIQRQVTVSPVGYSEHWDAWDGSVHQLGVTESSQEYMSFALELGVRESMVIVIDPSRDSVVAPHNIPQVAEKILTCDETWDIHNDSGEHQLSLSELKSWTELPGLEDYDGSLTYTTTVELANLDNPSQVELRLGDVGELAVVSVNDREAGVGLLAPYNFDITPYVKNGENIIKVTVTNSLANKYSDARISSGLLGPVEIVTRGKSK